MHSTMIGPLCVAGHMNSSRNDRLIEREGERESERNHVTTTEKSFSSSTISSFHRYIICVVVYYFQLKAATTTTIICVRIKTKHKAETK